jgi:hypothetical protein
MRNRLLAWAVLSAAGLTPACSPSASSDATDQTVSVSSHGMPLSEVPALFQRRALQRLERNGSGAWQGATLAPYAVALLRPDVDGVAYYEFQVLGGEHGKPQGYIIAATGEHDNPLPLAAESGDAPTVRLRKMSAREPSRYYMMDILTFVAESADGELLAKIGSLPVRPTIASEIGGQSPSDGALEGTRWTSWLELKRDFADAYVQSFDSSAQRFQEAWDRENELTDYGEALAVGQERWMRALENEVQDVAITGAGASAIEIKQRKGDTGEAGFAIKAVAAPAEDTADVGIRITYGSGKQETLHFGLVSDAFLTAHAGPAEKDGLNLRSNPHPCSPGPNSTCAPRIFFKWHVYYPEGVGHKGGDGSTIMAGTMPADARAQQAWYGQLKPNADYNPYDCASGCGGTAWAMLLAWADNRAEDPSSAWKNNWGIYRKGNLSTRGEDAVAPLKWEADGAKRLVGAMAKQLEGPLAFCGTADARATAPKVMGQVEDWVNDRSAVDVDTDWNKNLVEPFDTRGDLEDQVRRELSAGRPAIAGIGRVASPPHYPVVYGVEVTTRTVVQTGTVKVHETITWRINNGWGSELASDAVMEPYAWFVGKIKPIAGAAPDTANAPTPAECTNGAQRTVDCPRGQSGDVNQKCVGGRWTVETTRCVNTGGLDRPGGFPL